MTNFYRVKIKTAKNQVLELSSIQGISKRAVALDAMEQTAIDACQYVHVAHASGSETRFNNCIVKDGKLECAAKE
jgi:hypothetical protein